MSESSLRLIPLGGLGEFGLNALLLECAGRLLLVDAGVMFPPADLPGIDAIVPDFAFLAEHAGALEAIVLTHGHEDHIGALSFALNAAPAPVYGGPLTLGLAERRLRERGIQADLRPIRPGQVLELGPFRVHPVRVAHSIFDSYALVVETPAGVVILSGDLKLGADAPEHERTDTETLAEWGERGVLALLSDSTNVEMPGPTPGEDAVVPALEAVFARARGRILVACFATALPRIQRILALARTHGRKAAFVGRRMAGNAEVAQELGLLDVPCGSLVSAEAAAGERRERVALLVSGSQGEPLSGLSLISVGDHRDIRVEPGDIVVHSARVIPGNDRAVGRVFDHLTRRGCEIVHAGLAAVHVSGHGGRADMAELIRLVRPRYFVPIHGEYRLLAQHARLAREVGLGPEQVLLVEDGQTITCDADGAHLSERVATGRVLLDRSGAEGVAEEIVKDRRHLSSNGIVVPVIVIEKQTGRPSSSPEVVSRGLADAGPDLADDASRRVLETLEALTPEERQDVALTRERVRLDLLRFYKKRTARRPLVVPVVMEI